MKLKDLFLMFCQVLLLFSSKYSSAQDTIFIYDVANGGIAHHAMPGFNNSTPADSTNPSFGTHGITAMPIGAPLNTYPGTQISILQKATDFYSLFNFPFTALTSIRYGLNITAAVIGRRTLLVFNYDVYNVNPQSWRYLNNTNPFYENGVIQYGFSRLTPVRYYTRNFPLYTLRNFAVVEVAEDIGDESGYFGLAYDTTIHAYDSLLLYNTSYPNEGYPTFYPSPVNGDTLCMKYGYISAPDSTIFTAYWGGDGEYTSPFFDQQYRIRGLRWSYQLNYKLTRPDFYFLKYVVDSLVTETGNISQPESWNIFPNPVADNLTINFHKPLSTEATLSVTSILGTHVLSFSIPAGIIKKEIKVAELARGIYFLSIESKEKKVMKKFIKE